MCLSSSTGAGEIDTECDNVDGGVLKRQNGGTNRSICDSKEESRHDLRSIRYFMIVRMDR